MFRVGSSISRIWRWRRRWWWVVWHARRRYSWPNKSSSSPARQSQQIYIEDRGIVDKPVLVWTSLFANRVPVQPSAGIGSVKTVAGSWCRILMTGFPECSDTKATATEPSGRSIPCRRSHLPSLSEGRVRAKNVAAVDAAVRQTSLALDAATFIQHSLIAHSILADQREL